MKKIALTLLALLVVGCASPTIDSSSKETFDSSIKKVENSLGEEKKKEFQDALQELLAAEIGNALANGGDTSQSIMNKLNGKNADGVIAAGKAALVDRKKREKEQAQKESDEIRAEITTLEQEIKDAEAAKKALESFKISRSRFSYREAFGMKDPVIELTFRNGTKEAVSKVWFEATLSSPGRTIPWVKDTFNYAISGGIEPGEELTETLAPNSFGAWGKVPKDRNDMILTAIAVRVNGADDKTLYDSTFPEKNPDKIKELKDRLTELEKVIQSP